MTSPNSSQANYSRQHWQSRFLITTCLAVAFLSALPRLIPLIGGHKAVAASSDVFNLQEIERALPHLVTKPIEEIRCGQRVCADLPENLQQENEPEPDPATWRMVELEIDKVDGQRVEVKLLRPLVWLQQAGAISNGNFQLNVDELGIDGRAAVLSIKPCPPILSGDGEVVTGTFRHYCKDLVELRIEHVPTNIVCTSGHPIWSEDRQTFVRAEQLLRDERVRIFGNRCVKLIETSAVSSGAQVFNIEVSKTHLYSVGECGLLVHNAGQNDNGCGTDSDEFDEPEERTPKSRSGGARKPGTQGQMGNNQAENRLARSVAKRANLNKDQQRRFHDEISGMGESSFEFLLEIAMEIKNGEL